jgi:hypothetical protein
MRSALALALPVVLLGPVGASGITITPDNAWHEFDVDSLSARSGTLEWIALDGAALTFEFTTVTPVKVTVVHGGFGGHRFRVSDNGQPLDETQAGADTYPESKGLNFDAALADARWSRGVYTLAAGSHSLAGVLSRSATDNTGAPLNATVGALRVEAVAAAAVPTTPTTPTIPTTSDGGGCTLNPGVRFDPLLLGMTGLMLVHLVWQRLQRWSRDSGDSQQLM